MSAGSKQSSRWGSFLQQAVAGVESRLDNILAEDDEKPKPKPEAAADSPRTSTELPRDAPTKKNDRLQERLAKAVISRSAGRTPDGSNPPSQSATPNLAPASPRTSTDSRPGEEAVAANGKAPAAAPEPTIVVEEAEPEGADSHSKVEVASLPRGSFESSSNVDSEHEPRASSPVKLAVSETAASEGQETEQTGELVERLRADLERTELRRQEELHEYVERNEALQAKLKYLTKEVLASSERAAEEASSGSPAEKIAQRDEKIALLIEEGQTLSQNELRLMTTIKKLRARAAEDDKKATLSRDAADKAERAKAAALERVKAAEAAQVEETQQVKRLEKDLERTRADLSSRSTKIGDLQSQLNQAKANASSEELTKTRKSLDEERAKNSQLQEDLSTAKIEKKLSEDRSRGQIKELEENANREKERARVAELELRGEIGVLESRLETYRAQAEEISSGSSGDTQAKLFRQIETLQSQYSAASENWRGIESSLLARIAGLEKERDEVAAKESDLRRKNRDAGNKTRRAEEELEQANSKMYDLDEGLNKERSESSTLRASIEKLEADIRSLHDDLQTAQEQNKSLQQEVERKDAQLLNAPGPQADPVSPSIGGIKSSDRSNAFRRQGSSTFGLKDLASPTERAGSRKSSTQVGPNHFSPVRQDSMIFGSAKGSATQTPSVHTEHHDDFFDGVVTPATPERTINEMFSNSASGAGPSVQLVERMSAAVRRLESEKAASKEEVDRLHEQRDEAREQVVSLMQEVEEKRKADSTLSELETEVATLNQRYQTTLEMLGEKSERVEELLADIADMKEIYREALEKSIR